MNRLRLPRPSPAMVVALIALAVATSGTAYAATGGTFVLSKANTPNHVSTLTNPKGAVLALNSANSHTPLALNGPADVPPLSVNSTTLVPNLNAQLLDGSSAADLQASLAGNEEFHGPLPYTTLNQFAFSGPLSFVIVEGSAYATTPGANVGQLVRACPGSVYPCDSSTAGGQIIGQHYSFSNEANSHKPITSVLPAIVNPGLYTLAVEVIGNATSDASDEYDLAVVNLG